MWQTGHLGSLLSQIRLAHSIQKRLWPHGTRAAITSLSKQTEQSRLPFRLVPEEVDEDEEAEEEEAEEESQGIPGRDGMEQAAYELGKLRDPPPGSLRTRRASGCSPGPAVWLWRGGESLG